MAATVLINEDSLAALWRRSHGSSVIFLQNKGDNFEVQLRGKPLREVIATAGVGSATEQLWYIGTNIALYITSTLEKTYIPTLSLDDLLFDTETGMIEAMPAFSAGSAPPSRDAVEPLISARNSPIESPVSEQMVVENVLASICVQRARSILDGSAEADVDDSKYRSGELRVDNPYVYITEDGKPQKTALTLRGDVLGSIGQHARLLCAKIFGEMLSLIPKTANSVSSENVQYLYNIQRMLCDAELSVRGWARLMGSTNLAAFCDMPIHKSVADKAQMLCHVRIALTDDVVSSVLQQAGYTSTEYSSWELLSLAEASSAIDIAHAALTKSLHRALRNAPISTDKDALKATTAAVAKLVVSLIKGKGDREKPEYFLSFPAHVALGCAQWTARAAYLAWYQQLLKASASARFPGVESVAGMVYDGCKADPFSSRAPSTRTLPSVSTDSDHSSYIAMLSPEQEASGWPGARSPPKPAYTTASLLSPSQRDGTALAGYTIVPPSNNNGGDARQRADTQLSRASYETDIRSYHTPADGVGTHPYPPSAEFELSFSSFQSSPLITSTPSRTLASITQPPVSAYASSPVMQLHMAYGTPSRPSRPMSRSLSMESYRETDTPTKLPPGLYPQRPEARFVESARTDPDDTLSFMSTPRTYPAEGVPMPVARSTPIPLLGSSIELPKDTIAMTAEEYRHVVELADKFRDVGVNIAWGATPGVLQFQMPTLPQAGTVIPNVSAGRATLFRDMLREMQDVSHTRDESKLARLATLGYIEFSVAALHIGAHLCKDDVTSSFACQTIGNLAMIDSNRNRLAALGAIDAVIYTMSAHGYALRVQKDAVVALRHLAYENDDNKSHIIELGGVEAVIAAMTCDRRNPMAVQVQKQCCGALSIFAVHSSLGDAAKRSILQKGGLHAILQAIHDQSSDAQLVLAALKAITTLIGKPDARQLAREAGAVALCEYLASVPTLTNNREVMEALRTALRRLRG